MACAFMAVAALLLAACGGRTVGTIPQENDGAAARDAAPLADARPPVTGPCEDVEFQWCRMIRGEGDEVVSDLVVLGQDRIFVAGYFELTIWPDESPVESYDYFDLFLAEYDIDGAHVSSLTAGYRGLDDLAGVAADSAGNIYLAGSFSERIDLGGGPESAVDGYDAFVASLDPGGSQRWLRPLFGPDWDIADGIAVSPTGDVFVTGSFQETIDLGDGPVQSAAFTDAFVAAFDLNGAPRWSWTLGASFSDLPSDLAADDQGNVYVTGWFSGTADPGDGAVTSAGMDDVFLVSLDRDGAFRWAHTLGSAEYDRSEAVAVDPDGNVYVIGYFSGPIDLGDGQVTNNGVDTFLVSYDRHGSHRWSRAFSGEATDHGMDVVTDAWGNVFVTGMFAHAIDLGGGPVPGPADYNTFVASLGPDGSFRWARAFGTGGNNHGSARIAAGADGSVYLTGKLSGTVDFGGGPVTVAEETDVFLVSLGCRAAQGR